MAACTIVIELLDDGRYRATCHLFPDCEVVAATEEAARDGFQAVIAEMLGSRREHEVPASETLPPACDL
jgi:predicted RNase H-like HicB family nuclease